MKKALHSLGGSAHAATIPVNGAMPTDVKAVDGEGTREGSGAHKNARARTEISALALPVLPHLVLLLRMA